MTIEETREAAEVMLHFANGGEVEYKVRGSQANRWHDAATPIWEWNNCVYRKKPKPEGIWFSKLSQVVLPSDFVTTRSEEELKRLGYTRFVEDTGNE